MIPNIELMELAEKVVCDFYNITPESLTMTAKRCKGDLLSIRQNIWYILKTMYQFKGTEIAERYNYDDNTISQGIEMVQDEISVYKFTDHPTTILIKLIRQHEQKGKNFRTDTK